MGHQTQSWMHPRKTRPVNTMRLEQWGSRDGVSVGEGRGGGGGEPIHPRATVWRTSVGTKPAPITAQAQKRYRLPGLSCASAGGSAGAGKSIVMRDDMEGVGRKWGPHPSPVSTPKGSGRNIVMPSPSLLSQIPLTPIHTTGNPGQSTHSVPFLPSATTWAGVGGA